jgi:hypothetical protein
VLPYNSKTANPSPSVRNAMTSGEEGAVLVCVKSTRPPSTSLRMYSHAAALSASLGAWPYRDARTRRVKPPSPSHRQALMLRSGSRLTLAISVSLIL